MIEKNGRVILDDKEREYIAAATDSSVESVGHIWSPEALCEHIRSIQAGLADSGVAKLYSGFLENFIPTPYRNLHAVKEMPDNVVRLFGI